MEVQKEIPLRNTEIVNSVNTGRDGKLSDKKVKDMVVSSRRLVEVPYNATLAQTMNLLVANRVIALPVAAPPGQWIGAGGSMILESDKHTGAVRKQYIGMVTMLDILAHIAGNDNDDDRSGLSKKMAVAISSVIGHSPEGLSLWTLNPNTSVIDCMEMFSKGIHRALVPLDSHVENTFGAELADSATAYRMLTQMDLLRFLNDHASQLQGILSKTVEEAGALNFNAFAISGNTKVINAIRCLKSALLNAVPIVESSEDPPASGSNALIDGKGRRLIGTFSATDLKGCHLATLETWLPLTAVEFTEHVRSSPVYGSAARELVTCFSDTPLGEAMSQAIPKHVHRVWVVDHDGLLKGVLSLTDVIRVLRLHLLSESMQL